MSGVIKLGNKVKDKITGLTGIAVSRIEYLNGCVQFGIRPRARDGKMRDVEYIDEGELEVIEISKEKAKRPPGGIMPAAPKKKEVKK